MANLKQCSTCRCDIGAGTCRGCRVLKKRRRSKTKGERYAIKEYLKGKRCKYCGTADNITLDHIRPIAKGGSDSFLNWQPLCRACNQEKGDSWDGLRGHPKAQGSEEVKQFSKKWERKFGRTKQNRRVRD